MKATTFKYSFLKAIAWNGLLYGFYKISSTLFTIKLFHDVSTETFSVWALMHSAIFLVLVGIDGGLRKSIPKFAQLFIPQSSQHLDFVLRVFIVNFMLLGFLGLPTLSLMLHYFLPSSYYSLLLWYALNIFIIEGIISFCTIVYQAHFIQYLFALPYTAALLLETGINLYYLGTYSLSEQDLLIMLLRNKIVIKLCMGIIALIVFGYWMRMQNTKQYPPSNAEYWEKDFIKHTALMWTSTTIKVLSERNFLLILFTRCINSSTANLFKISHDSTMIFQRIALKIIGVSDTAFLAKTSDQTAVNSRLKTLLRIIIGFTIPLAFLVTAIFLYQLEKYSTQIILVFLIFTISYCIEIILSPYERLLETHNAYKDLWKSYAPYLIIFLVATASLIIFNLHIIIYLLIIQSGRVISATFMRFYAQQLINNTHQ